ncbi:50S ribosomal protein L17 [Candidatus Curtissbacteria bacterium RIFCSPLOWO2_01_FULL_38_11b]|uniref:50S ribosomal protein L17 n=1 Tax=Candidatus Curtissbacteria bacterium RIFCSPLOWO2_01_FULL_38_11b TaxID=1797725 RepID=A0A1F5H1Q3_9BACT|nr:MAG: 50S ribosomal protein L17 [Candidatus Curtissbacteria bacterium RIFCSPLOWO2_01_FULL_38_11b]
MRHAVFGKKLSRDVNSRKALLNGLASAILLNGQITTTLAKAKFASSYVEKLVTIAKKNKLSQNRFLASTLSSGAFLKLINEVGPHFEKRNGGYTRIIKLNKRRGDASQMAKLEFVDWDKLAKVTPKIQKKQKSTKATNKVSSKKEKLPKNKKRVTKVKTASKK